jgi:hypothetical protein
MFSVDDTCVYVVGICDAACIQAYWMMEGKLIRLITQMTHHVFPLTCPVSDRVENNDL